MSHSYNKQCENCLCKYCDCHEEIIKETLDGDLLGFCDDGCVEEYREEWKDDEKHALKNEVESK